MFGLRIWGNGGHLGFYTPHARLAKPGFGGILCISTQRTIPEKISFLHCFQSPSVLMLNPLTAKIFNLNCHPLKVVSR